MSEDTQYAVYLHPGALEVLGEAVQPYLSEGPHGPHIVCRDFDAGGALCEMTLEHVGEDGRKSECEVMVPIGMIRLVLSIGGVGDRFGFRPVITEAPATS